MENVTKSNVALTYYTWDPRVNGRGAFVNYSSFTGVNNNISSQINDTLQSGQGFFVQTSGASPSVTFKETDKTSGNTNVFRTSNTLTTLSIRLLLNTSAGTQNTADGAVVIFDNNYSAAIGNEDSYKVGNLDENISISHGLTDLSIEGRPIVYPSDTIYLKLSQYRQKDYFLKLDATNFVPGTTAFVKDAYLNQETTVNIEDSTLIPFSLTADSASFATDRFILVFKPGSVLPVTVTDVKAYQKDKGIQVDWISRSETNISRYEMEKSLNGQQFEKAGVVAAKGNNAPVISYGWFDVTPAEGANFYRIKIIEKTGAISYSPIVKVTIGKSASGIAVYPNPVKGNTISLHFTDVQKGKYTLNLYNNLGQKMLSKEIEHNGSSANYSIPAGKLISKGTYRLNVSNGETEMNTTVMVE